MKLAHLKMTEHMRLTDFEHSGTHIPPRRKSPQISHTGTTSFQITKENSTWVTTLRTRTKDYEGWRKRLEKADSIVHQDHYEVNNFSEWWTDDKTKEEPYQ